MSRSIVLLSCVFAAALALVAPGLRAQGAAAHPLVAAGPVVQEPEGPRPAQERPPAQGERGARQTRPADPEALEKGRLELNRILVAAGARANLPGRLEDYLLWPEVGGVRYDQLEIHRSRILRPGEPWRVNDLTPRFFFADGVGHGYLLLELITQLNENGDLRPLFRREVGGGDTYWAESDDTVYRAEKPATNAQRVFLGEYFYGLMPHSLALFDPAMVFLRNERVDGRTLAIYTLRLPAPFEAEYGHWNNVFTVSVDPTTHRIEQLQFADPFEEGVTIIVQYTDWVTLDAPEELRTKWRAGLRAELEEHRETLGDEGLAKLVARIDAQDGLVPRSILLPSRRVVFDARGGREREFLSADFHFETLPPDSYAPPWQSGSMYASPYRSDFFDPPAQGPQVPPAPPSDEEAENG
jgi:hypothetical protein